MKNPQYIIVEKSIDIDNIFYYISSSYFRTYIKQTYSHSIQINSKNYTTGYRFYVSSSNVATVNLNSYLQVLYNNPNIEILYGDYDNGNDAVSISNYFDVKYVDDDTGTIATYNKQTTYYYNYWFIVPKTTVISIGTLTNCTCNYNNGDTVDTSKNLIITANDGYEFNESSYQYKEGTETKNFTISSDKTTLTINMSSVADSITVGNISATEKSAQVYTISIGTLTNCTCNYNNGDTVDTSKNLIITANDGYEFGNSNYQYKEGTETKNFTISSDKTTLTINMSSVADSITVGNISATEKSSQVYTISIGTLANCTCNYNNGDTVDTSKNLIITANDGYEFDENTTFLYYVGDYSIEFNRTNKNILYAVLTNINANVTVNDITATLIEDTSKTISITGTLKNCSCNYANGEKLTLNKSIIITPFAGYEFVGVYTFLLNGATETFDVNANGQLVTTVDDVTDNFILDSNYVATKESNTTNFARIYKMTKSLINQYASKRFTDDSSGNKIDTGNYIVSLTKLKYTIPSEIVGDETNIVNGYYDTGIKAPAILNDDFTINLGTIIATRKYNNAYDFLNTNCHLLIPLFEPIKLDTYFCVGRTLKIKVYVNFYSKNATCIVTNDLNENMEFYSKQQVFDDIPFVQYSSNRVLNNIEDNYYYMSNKAKLVIIRNTPYQGSNYFGRDVIKQSTLEGLTGFTKVNNIEISSQMLKDEKDELDSILANGIIL